MADEPDVQVADITPDDFDGKEPKAEPSPAKETKEEVKAEAKVEPKAEVKEEAKAEPETPAAQETDGESEAKAKEPEETEAPKGKAEERKTQLNTEIRDLVSQRNALKEEVAKANEVYQPATEDELVDGGMTATDAKVESLRQQIELKDYNDRVADAQLTLSSESQRVLNDFPIFNSDTEQYDKELAEEAAGLLEANLILDPNTQQVIGSNVSPYQLYKTLARASGIGGAKGQMKGQQDTEQMLANTDAGGSATPEKKPVDPLTALWEGEL